MPKFKIDVEFQVWCSVCGEGLCFQSKGIDDEKEKKIGKTGVTGYGPGVLVEPCKKCLAKARGEV